MRIRATIAPGRWDDNMRAAKRATPVELTNAIRRIVARGAANIERRTPVGWSGAARGGWAHEVRSPNTKRPQGVITNPILYIDPLEDGRRPGKPPPTSALIPWVGTKLGIPPGTERDQVAFLVARAIGRRGTTGAHMIEDGWRTTVKEIRPELRKMGLAIVHAARGRR